MKKNRLKKAARIVQRIINFAFEYDFYDITDYIEFVPDYIRETINSLLAGDKPRGLPVFRYRQRHFTTVKSDSFIL